MAITYTRQSPSRDCLHHHVTCAIILDATESQFVLPTGIDGLTLETARINRHNGAIIRQSVQHFDADSRVHFFASEWAGLYYFCRYVMYRQRYECSCGVFMCSHIKQLRGI